jgi:hypothetical protein
MERGDTKAQQMLAHLESIADLDVRFRVYL